MTIKLKIDTKKEWFGLCTELVNAGLLRDVNANDITLPEDAFPLEIPVNTDGLLQILNNPLVKTHKKKIDQALTKEIKKIKPGLG